MPTTNELELKKDRHTNASSRRSCVHVSRVPPYCFPRGTNAAGVRLETHSPNFCSWRKRMISWLAQDTVGDKALRVVDGAIYVAKSAPLGTAVKVRYKLPSIFVPPPYGAKEFKALWRGTTQIVRGPDSVLGFRGQARAFSASFISADHTGWTCPRTEFRRSSEQPRCLRRLLARAWRCLHCRPSPRLTARHIMPAVADILQ